MSQSTRTAVAVVVVFVLAGAFWLLLLGPKRDKASELGEQTASLRSEVATEQQRADAAIVAKREFPRYYGELVLFGKAVPAEAATPSLLVQLNEISDRAKTSFASIATAGGGGGAVEAPAPTGTVSAEDAAALPPIGAAAGPAGLTAMPYSLQFDGGFFGIANFIEGLDSQVKTKDGVVVRSRPSRHHRRLQPGAARGRSRLPQRSRGEIQRDHLCHAVRPGPDRRRNPIRTRHHHA